MERRPDLVKQYQMIRAPSLILLNASGKILWRQNESAGDLSPLRLDEVEARVAQP